MSGVETTPFTLFQDFEVNARQVAKRRSLRYDINALADFEQLTGMGFGQLMSTKAVFATARAFMWAGLKHEDRTLTIEYVGTLLSRYIKDHKGSIDEALTVCFQAAHDQGAFGNTPQDEDGASDAGNAEAAEPTAVPSANGAPQLSAGSAVGASGSAPSNPSPTGS